MSRSGNGKPEKFGPWLRGHYAVSIGEAAREAAPYRKTAFQLRQGGDRSTEKTHYVECLFKEEWRFQREGKVQGSQTNSKEKFFQKAHYLPQLFYLCR